MKRVGDHLPYQFVGFTSNVPGCSSMVVGSLLALGHTPGWALLFSDVWIRLDGPFGAVSSTNVVDVAACAERWLRNEILLEASEGRGEVARGLAN